MWIIKSKRTGQEFVWGNKKEDDFIRFIPKQIGDQTGVHHTKEDFEASYIDSDKEFEYRHADTSNTKYVAAINGELCLCDLDGNVLDKAKMLKLACWPYDNDEHGKIRFLGNKFLE